MSDTRLSIYKIVNEFSRLIEINLMEQFVNGVREFAASIVNLKPFKNELRILKEITKERWSLPSYKVVENVCILSVLYFQVSTC